MQVSIAPVITGLSRLWALMTTPPAEPVLHPELREEWIIQQIGEQVHCLHAQPTRERQAGDPVLMAVNALAAVLDFATRRGANPHLVLQRLVGWLNHQGGILTVPSVHPSDLAVYALGAALQRFGQHAPACAYLLDLVASPDPLKPTAACTC